MNEFEHEQYYFGNNIMLAWPKITQRCRFHRHSRFDRLDLAVFGEPLYSLKLQKK